MPDINGEPTYVGNHSSENLPDSERFALLHEQLRKAKADNEELRDCVTQLQPRIPL